MPDSDSPTVGELARGLQAVLDRFGDLIRRIETSYVTKDVFELTAGILRSSIANEEKDRIGADDELRQRITRLESNQTWLVRTVVGALVLAALGVLFQKAHGL